MGPRFESWRAHLLHNDLGRAVPGRFLRGVRSGAKSERRQPVLQLRLEYASIASMLLQTQGNSSNPAEIAILTFNYHLALELALSRAGVAVNFGLEGNAEGVSYLKLHGSLGWTECSVCGAITPVDLRHILKRVPLNLRAEPGPWPVPARELVKQQRLIAPPLSTTAFPL